MQASNNIKLDVNNAPITLDNLLSKANEGSYLGSDGKLVTISSFEYYLRKIFGWLPGVDSVFQRCVRSTIATINDKKDPALVKELKDIAAKRIEKGGDLYFIAEKVTAAKNIVFPVATPAAPVATPTSTPAPKPADAPTTTDAKKDQAAPTTDADKTAEDVNTQTNVGQTAPATPSKADDAANVPATPATPANAIINNAPAETPLAFTDGSKLIKDVVGQTVKRNVWNAVFDTKLDWEAKLAELVKLFDDVSKYKAAFKAEPKTKDKKVAQANSDKLNNMRDLKKALIPFNDLSKELAADIAKGKGTKVHEDAFAVNVRKTIIGIVNALSSIKVESLDKKSKDEITLIYHNLKTKATEFTTLNKLLPAYKDIEANKHADISALDYQEAEAAVSQAIRTCRTQLGLNAFQYNEVISLTTKYKQYFFSVQLSASEKLPIIENLLKDVNNKRNELSLLGEEFAEATNHLNVLIKDIEQFQASLTTISNLEKEIKDKTKITEDNTKSISDKKLEKDAIKLIVKTDIAANEKKEKLSAKQKEIKGLETANNVLNAEIKTANKSLKTEKNNLDTWTVSAAKSEVANIGTSHKNIRAGDNISYKLDAVIRLKERAISLDGWLKEIKKANTLKVDKEINALKAHSDAVAASEAEFSTTTPAKHKRTGLAKFFLGSMINLNTADKTKADTNAVEDANGNVAEQAAAPEAPATV